jgi:2-succinyl-6-hydroxy-2,4-cyclohexadiene-1-carboxylate synthase
MSIVLLHGFLGSPLDWEPVLAHLQGDFLCIELPGHGKTPFSPEWDLPMPQAHLIGYSLGGRIAAQFAQKYPERVLSLTLLSAHPGLCTEEEKKARWEHDLMWANLLHTLPFDLFLQHWYAQDLFHSFQPNWNLRNQHNPKALAQTLLHYSLAKQKFIDMKRVIVGEWDAKFRALHPHGIVIEKAGHAVHLEQPKAVAEILKRQFNDLVSSGLL